MPATEYESPAGADVTSSSSPPSPMPADTEGDHQIDVGSATAMPAATADAHHTEGGFNVDGVPHDERYMRLSAFVLCDYGSSHGFPSSENFRACVF